MIPKLSDAAWTRRTADHLLGRAAYLGNPEEREEFYQHGVEHGVGAAVDLLLGQGRAENWEAFPFPGWAQGGQNGDGAGTIEERRLDTAGWMLGQYLGAAPVASKMLKFWLDHYPVDAGSSGFGREFIFFFRHVEILRGGALGSFRQLVKGVSWSEAMMRMLDLDINTNRFPNENWARELMELFTLGVHGGYSELDVISVARAFTGRRIPATWPYRGFLNGVDVDRGEKVVLNTTLAALPGGPGDEHGEAVIDLILSLKKTAEYLVWKLWRYFVSPTVPAAILAELKDRFHDPSVHDYEVVPLLRDIFTAEAFYADEVMGRQVKDPVDFMVTLLKMLQMGAPPWRAAAFALEELGYIPTKPPTIQGWAEPEGVGNQWLSTGAMTARLNFPTFLLFGKTDALARGAELGVEVAFPRLEMGDVIPRHLRGRRNIQLALSELQGRFLPGAALSPKQRRTLERQFVRTFRDRDDDAYRDTVRMLVSLPQFQLQ